MQSLSCVWATPLIRGITFWWWCMHEWTWYQLSLPLTTLLLEWRILISHQIGVILLWHTAWVTYGSTPIPWSPKTSWNDSTTSLGTFRNFLFRRPWSKAWQEGKRDSCPFGESSLLWLEYRLDTGWSLCANVNRTRIQRWVLIMLGNQPTSHCQRSKDLWSMFSVWSWKGEINSTHIIIIIIIIWVKVAQSETFSRTSDHETLASSIASSLCVTFMTW